MTTLRTIVLAACISITHAAFAAGPIVGGRGAGGAGAAPASLGAAMRDMASAYRALKAEAIDPAKMEQALKDVATMQRDAAISKLQIPPVVAKMTGDEKEKALENYRVMMVDLMRDLLDLEQAISDKKPDDAKKALTTIEDAMNKGHAVFAPGE